MRWRSTLLFILATALVLPACVKRIPASVGGDRQIVAGEQVAFGQPAEVPEGAKIEWRMGDGTSMPGPQVAHAWHRPGEFEVVVQVTDPDGEKRSDKAVVQVTRPALLDVVPSTAGFLVLLDQPAKRLSSAPMLLERVLPTGQQANQLLAELRESLGFDPFSEEGLRAAGVDPEGGLALIGLEGRAGVVAAISLLPGGAALETFRAVMAKQGELKEQASQADPAIIEMRSVQSGALQAAYTFFRGHMWVASDMEGDKDPVQALLGLRGAGAASGLGGVDLYTRAMVSRPEPGGVHLFLTRDAWVEVEREEMKSASEEERRRHEEIYKRLAYARADVDLSAGNLRGQLRIGLDGEEAARLTKVLRARGKVPAFRGMLGDDQHMVVKLSLDWIGLAKVLLDLADQGTSWADLEAALDELAGSSGVPVRKGLLENLGDNSLLSLKARPTPILGMVDSRERPRPTDLFQGVWLIEISDPDLFASTLDGLEKMAGQDQGLSRLSGNDKQGWRIGPEGLGLVLALGSGMVAVATSAELAAAALSLAASPGEPSGTWPESLESPAAQVMALDLGRLLNDIANAPLPPDSQTAVLVKSMIKGGMAQVGQLGLAQLDLVLEQGVLILSARLNLE